MQFFNACFLLLKRSKIGFNDSTEEEKLDLLSAASPGPSSSAGQLHVSKDALIGPSELANSGARGKSSAAKAPEEGAGTLHELVKLEAEMPEECPLAFIVLPEQEGATMEPPSTLDETIQSPFLGSRWRKMSRLHWRRTSQGSQTLLAFWGPVLGLRC